MEIGDKIYTLDGRQFIIEDNFLNRISIKINSKIDYCSEIVIHLSPYYRCLNVDMDTPKSLNIVNEKGDLFKIVSWQIIQIPDEEPVPLINIEQFATITINSKEYIRTTLKKEEIIS
jgi:hypothetical protein